MMKWLRLKQDVRIISVPIRTLKNTLNPLTYKSLLWVHLIHLYIVRRHVAANQIISVCFRVLCEEMITFKSIFKSMHSRHKGCWSAVERKFAASGPENYKDTKIRPNTWCMTQYHLAGISDILSIRVAELGLLLFLMLWLSLYLYIVSLEDPPSK